MAIRKQTCERCRGETLSLSMSYFNTDEICPPCEEKERAHPKFKEARAAEVAECKKGNYNFPGIGLPPELATK